MTSFIVPNDVLKTTFSAPSLSFSLVNMLLYSKLTHAICKCCKTCLDKDFCKHTICICSNSQIALLAVFICNVTSAFVCQCFKVLYDLASYNKINLSRVTSLTGIQREELADELATKGSSISFTGPVPVFSITPGSIKNSVLYYFSEAQ